MKPLTSLWALSLLLCATIGMAQSLDNLTKKDFGKTTVYYSQGEDISGNFSGELCAQANTYFTQTLANIEVPLRLLVLSKKDWPLYTQPGIIYGMPHYLDDGLTLIVAAEDNAFWSNQVPDPSTISEPYRGLIPVVYNLNGTLSGRYFFDLLAVHELSHAWHSAAKLNTQRYWLSELFCNIMLHTFIAEEREEFLAALETLPAYWSSIEPDQFSYTSLEQFENDYNKIAIESPSNYGWYQFRFHRAASLLYRTAGAEVTKKLWNFMQQHPQRLSDEDLLRKLGEEVHPSLAELIQGW